MQATSGARQPLAVRGALVRRATRALRYAAFSASVVAVFATASATTPIDASTGTPDVLDRPALRSGRAATSVMLAIARAGTRIVAAGERGIIVWSDDNGRHWQQATVPVSVSLTSVSFADNMHGWATGHSGVVLRTDDGGRHWRRQLDGVQAARLLQEAAHQGLPGAGSDPAQALANATRLVAEGPSKPFLDVHAFDAKHALIVGAFGLVFVTHDAGETWVPVLDRIDNPQGKHLYAVRADGEGYVLVGEQGAVFRSTDGGEHFTAVATPYNGTYFGAIATPDGTLVVYGLRGNAYWRQGHNTNWHRSPITGATASITAGLRLSTGALVLLDDSGRLLASRDGGRSFSVTGVPPEAPYTGVVEAADGALVVSGMRGLARVTFPADPMAPTNAAPGAAKAS